MKFEFSNGVDKIGHSGGEGGALVNDESVAAAEFYVDPAARGHLDEREVVGWSAGAPGVSRPAGQQLTDTCRLPVGKPRAAGEPAHLGPARRVRADRGGTTRHC